MLVFGHGDQNMSRVKICNIKKIVYLYEETTTKEKKEMEEKQNVSFLFEKRSLAPFAKSFSKRSHFRGKIIPRED